MIPDKRLSKLFKQCLSRALIALSLACQIPSLQGVCRADDDGDRPNIIFILADDLGYGDLSCFGQTNFSTPRIDRLAEEGMRLTNHYAGSTVCAPSRACLLAGQHTGHVYQRFNGNVQFRPDPDDRTVARLLKDAGYATAMIGKSGLSCNSEDGSLPNRKGFDHFFGYVSHRAAHRYYPEQLWRNGAPVGYPDNHDKSGAQYSGDLFLADALQFIERHKNGPFFLHLSLQQPHADLAVPLKWKEPFLEKYEETPFEGGHYRAESHPKATYAGMVTYLDHTVGKIIDKLREANVSENTLVIFSSDNGAMSEGGWSRRYFNSSGPLRGGKRDLYEGGIRVPTIAWWPGKVAPGSESPHVSAFWDFLPTVCEIIGVQTPSNTDGISYLPTLLGKGEQQTHPYLYWEFYEQGGKQAVRMGKWKGVRLDVSQNPDGALELYDLEADLGEAHNVALKHPDVARRLEELIRAAHTDSEIVSFAKRSKRPSQ